jgi:hypothetical protein
MAGLTTAVSITFEYDQCSPPTALTPAAASSQYAFLAGPAVTITVAAATGIAPVACSTTTPITYVAVVKDHTDGLGSANDVLLKAAINVADPLAIVVTHTNAALNGYTAEIYVKPVSAVPITIDDTAMWSTQTVIFDNGCEGATSLTASADVVSPDYTLGSGASATTNWMPYNTATFPGSVVDPTCSW